jgi:2-polyprenyl-6-methoxyphenol hydroxylase-like FAD-dependent oxidoreductase
MQQREATSTLLPGRMSCDVAVVGYGPVGIVFSALLAKYGLKVAVIERWPERYRLPRAVHFDGEIMRTAFQSLDIAEQIEIISRALVSFETVTPEGEVLESVVAPYFDGSGWRSDYLFYQPEFEDVIVARGIELGVTVIMGATVTDLRQQADSVELTVHASDHLHGEPTIVQAAFVVGADGAKSFIRQAIGAIKKDLGFPKIDNLVVDFIHNDPDRDIPQMAENRSIVDPKRPTLLGRWAGGRMSRCEFRVFEQEDRDFIESDEKVWSLIAPYGLTPDTGHIHRKAIYTFESSVTSHWRDGRVFLMGDAAHTTPPYLGQGMCSGVRDAVNLAWKLVAVLAGKADLSLLDTYESERSPAVVGLIKLASAIGERVQITDPEQAKLRDDALRAANTGIKARRSPPFPRLGDGLLRSAGDDGAHGLDGLPSIQGRVVANGRASRLDQLLEPGWSILSRHRVPEGLFNARQKAVLTALSMQFAHVSRGAGTHFIDLDADYDLWFRASGRKAFIVRPDRYIFGSASTIEDLPALVDSLENKLVAHGWLGIQP